MTALNSKKCLPCEGLSHKMTRVEILPWMGELKGWEIALDDKSISKQWVLKNFVEAVSAIQHITQIAEAELHHPDLHLTRYKNLKVVLYTHALDGITENDLILAAKINKVMDHV